MSDFEESVIAVKLVADAEGVGKTVRAMVEDVRNALGMLRAEINQTSAALKLPDADTASLRESLNRMNWQYVDLDNRLKEISKHWEDVGGRIQAASRAIFQFQEMAGGHSIGSGLPYREEDVNAARDKIRNAAESLANALTDAQPLITKTQSLHEQAVQRSTNPGVLESLASTTPITPAPNAKADPERLAAATRWLQQHPEERFEPSRRVINEHRDNGLTHTQAVERATEHARTFTITELQRGGIPLEAANTLYEQQKALYLEQKEKLTSKSADRNGPSERPSSTSPGGPNSKITDSESKSASISKADTSTVEKPVYQPASAPERNAIEQAKFNETVPEQKATVEAERQREERVTSKFDLDKFGFSDVLTAPNTDAEKILHARINARGPQEETVRPDPPLTRPTPEQQDLHQSINANALAAQLEARPAAPQEPLHPRFTEATDFAFQGQTLTVNQLMEGLAIKRPDAQTLMAQLEAQGVVGPAVPFKPRQVLQPEPGITPSVVPPADQPVSNDTSAFSPSNEEQKTVPAKPADTISAENKQPKEPPQAGLPSVGDRIEYQPAGIGVFGKDRSTGVVTGYRQDPVTGDHFPMVGQEPIVNWYENGKVLPPAPPAPPSEPPSPPPPPVSRSRGNEPPEDRGKKPTFDLDKFDIIESPEETRARLEAERHQAISTVAPAQDRFEQANTTYRETVQTRDVAASKLNQGRELTDNPEQLAPLERELAEAERQVSQTERERTQASQLLTEAQQRALDLDKQVVQAGGQSVVEPPKQQKQGEAEAVEQAAQRETRALSGTEQAAQTYENTIRQAAQAGADGFSNATGVADQALEQEARTAQSTGQTVAQAQTETAQKTTASTHQQTESVRTGATQRTSIYSTAIEKTRELYQSFITSVGMGSDQETQNVRSSIKALDEKGQKLAELKAKYQDLIGQQDVLNQKTKAARKDLADMEKSLPRTTTMPAEQERLDQIWAAAERKLIDAKNAQTALKQEISATNQEIKQVTRSAAGMADSMKSWMGGRLIAADLSGSLGSLANVITRVMSRMDSLKAVMASAFDAFLVVGMIELIGDMIMKVVELARAWDPVYQAQKRYDDETKESLANLKKLVDEEERLRRARIQRERGETAVAEYDQGTANLDQNEAKQKISSIDVQIQQQQKIVDAGTVKHHDPSGQEYIDSQTKEAQAAQINIDRLERDRENAEHELAVATAKLREAQADVAKHRAQDLVDAVQEQVAGLRAQGRYTAQAEAELWGGVAEQTRNGGHETEAIYREALNKQAELLRQAAREATQILRSQDQEEFSDLQASHKLTLAEEIDFWEKKLALERANTDRSREIKRTIGTLDQRRDTEMDRRAVQAENQHAEGMVGPDGKPDRAAQLNFFNQLLADTKPNAEAPAAPVTPVQPLTIPRQIAQTAQNAGVDPKIALSVAQQESGQRQFDENGRVIQSTLKDGKPGALGVMQLMPQTAAAMGVNPFDTTQNIQGGITYLAQLFTKYGDWSKALQAYNWGPGHVDSGAPVPNDVQKYASTILHRAQTTQVPALPETAAITPRRPETTAQYENAQAQIARLAPDAIRQTDEDLVEAQKKGLEEKKKDHVVSLQEEIDYWARLAAADRLGGDGAKKALDQAESKLAEARQKWLQEQRRIAAEKVKEDLADKETKYGIQEEVVRGSAQLGVRAGDLGKAEGVAVPQVSKPSAAENLFTMGGASSAEAEDAKILRSIHQQEFQDAMQSNARELQIYQGDAQKREQLLEQQHQLVRRYQQQEARDTQTIVAAELQTYIQFIEQVQQAFFHGFNQWLQGQKTFGQAMKQSWNEIVMSVVQDVEKMASQWITKHLVMLAASKLFHIQELASTTATNAAKTASDVAADTASTTSTAVKNAARITGDTTAVVSHVAGKQVEVAADQAAATQSQGISIAEHIKEAFADAKLAAAHAFTATVGIPVVGPILAPAAAAAAFTGVMAFAAFEQGGIVPNTGVAMVHGGEMVLPAALSQKVQNSVTQPQTTNINQTTQTDGMNTGLLQQIATNTANTAAALGYSEASQKNQTDAQNASYGDSFLDNVKQGLVNDITNSFGLPNAHLKDESMIQLLQDIADNTSTLKRGIFSSMLGIGMGMFGLPFFEDGGIVPSTGPAVLHKNEMVLPSHIASHVLNTVGSPVTTNVYSDLASYGPANPGVLSANAGDNSGQAPTIQQISEQSSGGDTHQHLHLNYAPNITGAPNMSKAEFGAMLREHADDVGRIAQQKVKQFNR